MPERRPAPASASVADTGVRDRFHAAWSLLTRWRDWALPVKFAAITVLPLLFVVVLGAVVIGNQVAAADSYRQVDRQVATGDQVRKLANWLQRERTASAVLLASGSRDPKAELQSTYSSTDDAVTALTEAVDRTTFGTDAATARYADARTSVASLPVLRDRVLRASVDPAKTISQYSSVIRSLLNLDAALSEQVVDPQLGGTAGALHDLQAAVEEVYYQRALLDIGIIRGSLSQTDRANVAASQARFADRIADFRSRTDAQQQQDYQRLVSGPQIKQRQQIADRIATGALDPASLSLTDWNNAAEMTIGRMSALSADFGRQLRVLSGQLQDEASDGAGVASVLLLVALALALGAMILVARHLLQSLRVLRRSALQVAERDLPQAVAAIRDSGTGRAGARVRPVAVHTKDEVGQVARAFDAVHNQALRLAAEQAGLRANYGSVFVNLSRRSQGLVQRQLQLLERLERDEEDPDQLATLFQLDHLATRMRRNNENLMVLSGSDLTRRSNQPVPLADLLRAAVAEIEQYRRVLIQAPADAVVVGYVASDLVRLIAELLDNATAFSAPETQVTIASRHTEDGAVGIDVLDHGIGMSDEEVTDANQRLAGPGSVDVSASRRMGLFVVGRLAGRHNVVVRLHGGTNIAGVRASVVVPSDLVSSRAGRGGEAALPPAAAPNPSAPNPSAPPSPRPRPSGLNGSTAVIGGLPQRGGTNGAAPGGPAPNGNGTNGNGSNGTGNRGVNGGNGAGNRGYNGGTNGTVNGTNGSNGSNGSAHRVRDDAELPLPRRSSAAENPRKQDDLFAAGATGNWWDTGTQRKPASPDLSETTPIFDEMVSAWFRAETAPDVDREVSGDDEAWGAAAAADGWQTAEQVSTASPSEFLDTGLPRRTPREKLVPGSIGGPGAPGGRAATGGTSSNGSNGKGHNGSNGSTAGNDGARNGARPDRADLGERGAHELRTRLNQLQDGLARGRGIDDRMPAWPGEDTSGAHHDPRWQFASDEGFAAAEAAESADSAVDDRTDGGLPQRSPRQRLVPGSIGGVRPDPTATQWSRQDAEALRGRLGSFQRGVSRGRRSLADQSSGSGAFDNTTMKQESE